MVEVATSKRQLEDQSLSAYLYRQALQLAIKQVCLVCLCKRIRGSVTVKCAQIPTMADLKERFKQLEEKIKNPQSSLHIEGLLVSYHHISLFL